MKEGHTLEVKITENQSQKESEKSAINNQLFLNFNLSNFSAHVKSLEPVRESVPTMLNLLCMKNEVRFF